MIEIKITADNAEGVASQLHEFVNAFVLLARGTMPAPFDAKTSDAKTEAVMAAREEKVTEPRKPRQRKTAEVIDGSANEPDDKMVENPKTDEPSDDDVREILNRLRKDKGNEALGKVVTQFAPRFSEVPRTSYAQLYAVAKRALAA